MPVSFNSPPRNLFLLGSGGQQALTNFFDTINRAGSSINGNSVNRFNTSDIAYSDTDQKFLLAGTGKDSNTVSFGWMEKQAYDAETDPANPTNVEDWRRVFNSPANNTNTSTTLNFMKQTTAYGGDIIIGGKTGSVPWISRYNASGAQQWVSTSQSGDVEYFGVACTTSGYYACGHKTGVGIDPVGFVEKWTGSGTPLWGKSATHINGEVKLNKIEANERGEVVVVGSVTDQAYIQGYLAKIDTTTGDILWDRTINSGRSPSLGFKNDVEVKNVHIDGNDQIYVVGTEFADTFPVYKKGFIIKYSAEGNLIWHKTTPSFENHDFLDLWSDTPVEQTVVLSRETFPATGSDLLSLIKYSKNGDVVFRRRIISDTNFVQPTAGLDGDPSFYYMLFVEEEDNVGAGTSKNYTFGKVSASGNGFGAFTYETGYDPGTGVREIDYTVNTNTPSNPIGRLADGSVRNDSSDFISYPYSGLNLLLGDDLATNVAYKKTRHKDKDLFEYSGSPAVRVVDFQKANLLGDVYSGSGDWLDQSGKGNSAEVSDQEPFPGTGAIKLENASSDSFEIPYSSDWILGTEWTIEFYIKAKTRRSDKLIGTRGDSSPNGWEIVYNSGQIGIEQYGTENTGGQQRTSQLLPLREWTHVAIVNYDGGVKIYYDGVDTGFNWTGSSTSTWPAGGNHVLRIGKPTAFNEAPHVLMSNIHIVKGSALYTSAFSVPSLPLEKTTGTVLLTARGSTMSDDSDSNHSISTNGGATIGDEFFNVDYNSTDYCWQFNGSSENYMSIPNFNTANNINFSIEVWWKADSLPAYSSPTSKGYIFDQTPINEGVALRLSTAGDITTFAYPNIGTISSPSLGGARLVSSGTAVQTGVWYHTVTVFETNKVSMYVNGTLVDTDTGAMNYVAAGVIDQSYPFTIGSGISSAAARNYEYLDGKIGEFRIYQKVLTPAQVFQNYNATKSKYTNQASTIGVKVGDAIRHNGLILHYDFNNKYTYDPSANLIFPSNIGKLMLNDANNVSMSIDYSIKDPFGEYGGVLKCEHASTASGYFRRGRNTPLTAGKTYTLSLYFKNGTISGAWEGRNTTNGPAFSCATFSPTFEAPMQTFDKNTPVGNGWYKQIFTFTPQYSQTYQAGFSISQGQAPLGIWYLAGFQLEEADTDGRFIPTKLSEVPRSNIVRNLSSSSFMGTVSSNDTPLFIPEPYGYFRDSAGNVDNTGGITVPTAGLPAGASSRTMEAWIYMDSLGSSSNPVFFSYGTASAGQQSGLRFVSNGLQVSFWTATYDFNTGFNPGLNVWFHYVATYDGSTIEAYVNGTSVGTKNNVTLNTVLATNLTFFYINDGADPGNNYPHNGRIGEARIYDRALTSTEVSLNYLKTKDKYGL